MKKLLPLLLALALTGCGHSSENIQLTVFAAASLTETLEEIKPLYEEAHPGVTLTYNFDSSGTLQTQIQEGAACDLFLSAGQKQMDALEEDGLVRGATRINLLENKVVLCVPQGNPKGIESFDQLAQALPQGGILMAMGNSDVPVGQYTRKILQYYGLDEAALAAEGCLTYGTNVKEVATQITEQSVDCGVVYCTDAYSAQLTVVDSAVPEMCGQVVYPAAVLAGSARPDDAQAFLSYLTGDDAMAVFTSVGFSPAA